MSQTWWDAPPSDLRSIWWGQSTQPCFSSLLIFHGAPNGKNRFWPEAVTENGMGTSPLPPPDEIFVISYIPAYVSLGFSFIRDSTLEMFCGVVVAGIQPQRSLSSNGVWPDLRRFPCKMQQTLSCKWTFMSICICITRLSPCGEIRAASPGGSALPQCSATQFFFSFSCMCVFMFPNHRPFRPTLLRMMDLGSLSCTLDGMWMRVYTGRSRHRKRVCTWFWLNLARINPPPNSCPRLSSPNVRSSEFGTPTRRATIAVCLRCPREPGAFALSWTYPPWIAS